MIPNFSKFQLFDEDEPQAWELLEREGLASAAAARTEREADAKAEMVKMADVVVDRLRVKRITPTADGPLTPRQVATLLGIAKPEQVLAFIHSGELRATNVGRGKRATWRISREDLESFRAKRAAVAPIPLKTRRRRPPLNKVTEYF